ncbi:hypothetical protein GSI_08814 [Ganoderma sinense ZZ0214-1]|uniref:Uncharacterized protein n=1 Tax=Ganoderma sinense ZZ0214-1 TaxID=1077348 RepID=A0A2G8S4S0_9APHY|nr:hypothetical protein GSI_08814 [Ganoderma sinense ZZ0214-1]
MVTLVQPLGKRFLIRKCSNAENLPPSASSKKADALVSAREASRRRRARVVSGNLPLKVKKVVHNAQRRASKAAHLSSKPLKPTVSLASIHCSAAPLASEQVIEVSAASEATTAPTPKQAEVKPDTLNLPRFLRRPPSSVWPVDFDRANIDACSPELEGVDFSYIMQGLEVTGPSMWNLVKTAHIDRTSMGRRAALPDEVNVIIADHAALCTPANIAPSHPTHVLAVWELPHAHPVHRKSAATADARRKVSLIPAHNLVLAMHCAKWFKLGPTNTSETRVLDPQGLPGTQITLPIVPLAVPHPESFLLLLQAMYTHKASWLMDQLVPVQKPAVAFPSAANPAPENPHYILETGRRLAARYTPSALLEMVGTVVGLWQNAVYLGVSDRRLWTAMDWSYDMLLTGLGFALRRPDLVPRPQMGSFRWTAVPQASECKAHA